MSSKTKANVAKPKRPPYEEMIREAIIALKDRKGSSRHAIKKYLINTYKIEDNPTLTSTFRKALNKGVDKGLFEYYNGPKGTIKVVKNDAEKKKAEKKPRSVNKTSGTKDDEAVKKTKKSTVSKTSKTKPVKKAAVEKKVSKPTSDKKTSKPTSDKKTSTTRSTRKSTTKDTEKDAKDTTKRATRSTTKSTEKSSAATKSASKDVGKKSKPSTSQKAKTSRKKATKADA